MSRCRLCYRGGMAPLRALSSPVDAWLVVAIVSLITLVPLVPIPAAQVAAAAVADTFRMSTVAETVRMPGTCPSRARPSGGRRRECPSEGHPREQSHQPEAGGLWPRSRQVIAIADLLIVCQLC